MKKKRTCRFEKITNTFFNFLKCGEIYLTFTIVIIFKWGVGDGQGGLACCNSWGSKESDMTEWLNWTELKRRSQAVFQFKIDRWGRMGHEPQQCLLLQLLPLKEQAEQGKEHSPAAKLPVLKLFRPGVGRGSREVGVEPWDPWGKRWGWGLRAGVGSSLWPALEEGGRRGHKVEVVELDLERPQGDWER